MDRSTDRITAVPPDAGSPAMAELRQGNKGSRPRYQIEEDIKRTRARLSGTIAALERQLMPDRVVAKGAEWLRTSLEAAPRTQTWAYAIPLALIASGLGWLFMVRRRDYGAGTSDGLQTTETPPAALSCADSTPQTKSVSRVDEGAAI
jgi:hypothetical protein